MTENSQIRALEIAGVDDKHSMTLCAAEKQNLLEDWNLMLIATSNVVSESMLEQLNGAIIACGGWVLSHGVVSERCADIDFEFPRTRCMEIYGLLVAVGMTLSPEAHRQLAGLCHCTRHIDEQSRSATARVNLSLYAREGSESFLGEPGESLREAA